MIYIYCDLQKFELGGKCSEKVVQDSQCKQFILVTLVEYTGIFNILIMCTFHKFVGVQKQEILPVLEQVMGIP